MMQGRRDFALRHRPGVARLRALAGPKRLWLGLHGHAPSTFPAADTARDARRGRALVRPLPRAATGSTRARGRSRSRPRSWRGEPRPAARRCRRSSPTFVSRCPASTTIARSRQGRAHVRAAPRPPRGLRRADRAASSDGERAAGRGSSPSSRARTPAGKEIVVAGGGVPTHAGRAERTGSSSANQATFVPQGSRLTLTIGSSSLAQNPRNLLYLDLPMRVERAS